MNKFTKLMLVVLFTTFAMGVFAQSTILPVTIKDYSSDEKSGWIGNIAVDGLSLLAPGSEYAIRVAKVGTVSNGNQITKIRFYSDHQNYSSNGVTSNSYQIKIYTGATFDEIAGASAI